MFSIFAHFTNTCHYEKLNNVILLLIFVKQYHVINMMVKYAKIEKHEKIDWNLQNDDS